ncbi:MAG: hypothetical protein GTO26_02485 [Planctomycetales bacterium]|nr:hypothetical protein [Planctomycetales bacterium]NIN76674.1 hypothetical protein [Planctomycetales bacterium]NIO33862.1 hypothetical protein [Planctomycetales bacterium]NIO45669.1 hypothetical protein [Planctomycetales bacterium]NIP68293.1 hypothetical protein [Planctomycetales bacterium]
MGRFFDLIRQRKTFRRIAPLIREFSQQCQADVWDRVRERIFGMDLFEARGYVRARAIKVVRRYVDGQLHHHPQLDARSGRQLKTLVTERVTQLVVTDLMAGGPAARRPAA